MQKRAFNRIKVSFLKKKSQASMEFLMIYGWAILIILVVLTALFYFDVFSTKKPNLCSSSLPIRCSDVMLTEDGNLKLVLASKNVISATLVNYNLTLPRGASCIPDSDTIPANTITEVSCNFTNLNLVKGQSYYGTATITYISESSNINHTTMIQFSGNVEKSSMQGLGGVGGGGTPLFVLVSHYPQNPNISQEINITAIASSPSGIKQIQIYIDNASVKICLSTTSCSFISNSYLVGIHTYYATASDINNNQSRDPSIGAKSFTITPQDNNPPNITITNPKNNEILNGVINITANATDDIGVVKVEFYDSLSLIGTNTNSPYSISWDTTNLTGVRSLYAKAYDTANNIGTSSIVNVTINVTINDTIKPIVSVTHYPQNPNNLQEVTLTATATDASGIAQIQIYIDNNSVQICTLSPCSTLPTTYSLGTHTYYATALDINNNQVSDPINGIKSFIVAYQPIGYSDVLVIINSNSQVSEQVGTYFANARNIPQKNIIRINAPTNEEITPSEFNNLRLQTESYIINNSLNTINYIVTTKGVPLKVKPASDSCFSPSSACASVESELTLILGPYNSSIGMNGIVFSPYYYQNAPFSKSKYGIYLVTRLDGYTFDQIKAMIDKVAQPITITNSAKFVFDQDPDWNSNLPGLNNAMIAANSILTSRGLNSSVDTTTKFLTNESNVIGYVSWGSNDHYANNYTRYAKPHNIWHPGAIVETYVSTSGRTFTWPPSYGQSLIADLIEEEVSGAKGYVYEPYSFAMAIVSVLFDRYTNNYNLAESFYMASRSLSWMDVVIGDPKASIKIP